MSLWVDKYRPKSLENLDYHPHITSQLRTLAQGGDVPHLLFYGPSGAGKRTRMMAVLRELYGSSVDKVKIDQKTFETPSGKKLDIHLMSSLYHVEINPSDVGFYDRVVIQEIIKDIAQTQQISTSAQREYKVVIINEADGLSKDAQHALRRTMEKYMSNLRIFLVCNHLGKIIEPLQSRCILVRVPVPAPQTIVQTLHKVAAMENMTLPESLAVRIAEHSEGNLRKALLAMEATKAKKYPFGDNQSVEKNDWEEYIDQLASFIMQEQSPSRLLAVRAKLYELLSHCIPASLILKKLTFELCKSIDGPLKLSVAKEAAFYEHRMTQGTKMIFHLEAFVAKFMSIYKRYLMELADF